MRLGIPGSTGSATGTSNRATLANIAREAINSMLASGVRGSGLATVQALQQFFDG